MQWWGVLDCRSPARIGQWPKRTDHEKGQKALFNLLDTRRFSAPCLLIFWSPDTRKVVAAHSRLSFHIFPEPLVVRENDECSLSAASPIITSPSLLEKSDTETLTAVYSAHALIRFDHIWGLKREREALNFPENNTRPFIYFMDIAFILLGRCALVTERFPGSKLPFYLIFPFLL